jgi:RNase P subunit RPR2
VEETELELLNRLAEAQMLHKEDVDNSLLAVEGFVLEHWKELDSLQDKKSFEEVSTQFIQRMAAIAAKHRSKLLSDAKANKELVNLLRFAQSTELNAEDKDTLRKHFIDLLKHIPLFSMISLPQNFLSLQVLTQILPRNFIPDVLEGVK